MPSEFDEEFVRFVEQWSPALLRVAFLLTLDADGAVLSSVALVAGSATTPDDPRVHGVRLVDGDGVVVGATTITPPGQSDDYDHG
ncbi:hypothetical protein GB931_03940 [Modestobacter sp. I12A-02628]|uniref:Uncharacterized protein n=1 Tax=Goekera deserti TaxID=2497753 RepID=A0A7K3WKF9_9ACTN|nr:hypothetical protein [Goekera deserti]MPQ97090.1 hypothetical protein [Goekera deserti]NDI46593.1 hypothetical protein [Goekera deserti]NEL56349.1 hypothetical protein [Goekera deserti]